MKRICFDIESSYYKQQIGIFDIETHRKFMKLNVKNSGKIDFYCGVLYDEARDIYEEFGEKQAGSLIERLAAADELVSHSGTRHDLLILEQVCGDSVVVPLWSIRHHDLLDMVSWESLENLGRRHVPGLMRSLESAREARCADAARRWPEEPKGKGTWRPRECGIECRLAKARFDVELTYNVFKSLTG